MRDYRNNSGNEKRSVGDKDRKRPGISEEDFLFARRNYKHDFFSSMREGEHKKREIVEGSCSVEKKIKESTLEGCEDSNEKEKSMEDYESNIDVSEYTYTINNVGSSSDEDEDDNEYEENELEEESKEDIEIKEPVVYVDTKDSKGGEKEVHQTVPVSTCGSELNHTEEICSSTVVSETITENNNCKRQDNSKEKVNLKKYVYVKLKVNHMEQNMLKCRIEKGITIKRLKYNLKTLLHADYFRIIYKGRLLKDMEKLSKYDIKVGDTIFVIKSNDRRGVGGSMDVGISSSQLSALKDTDEIQRFDDNGNLSNLLSSMFDHGDFFKSLVDSNEQLKKLREKMPEINFLLNDSQAIKQSIHVMKNPSLMKELMRNTDRAISNIEAIPGGFNALSRMYHTFQEPMYSMMDKVNEGETNKMKHYDLHTSTAPTNEAFPNPWVSKKHDPNYFLLSPEEGKKRMTSNESRSKSRNSSKNKKMELTNVVSSTIKNLMDKMNMGSSTNFLEPVLNETQGEGNIVNNRTSASSNLGNNNLSTLFSTIIENTNPTNQLNNNNNNNNINNTTEAMHNVFYKMMNGGFPDTLNKTGALNPNNNLSTNQSDILSSNTPNMLLGNIESMKEQNPNNSTLWSATNATTTTNNNYSPYYNFLLKNGFNPLMQNNNAPNQMNSRLPNTYSQLLFPNLLAPMEINNVNDSLNTTTTSNATNQNQNTTSTTNNNNTNNTNNITWYNQNMMSPLLFPPTSDLLYSKFANTFQENAPNGNNGFLNNDANKQKVFEETKKLMDNVLMNSGFNGKITLSNLLSNLQNKDSIINVMLRSANEITKNNNVTNMNSQVEVNEKDDKEDLNHRDQQVALDSMNFLTVDDKETRDKGMSALSQTSGNINNGNQNNNSEMKELTVLYNENHNKNTDEIVNDSINTLKNNNNHIDTNNGESIKENKNTCTTTSEANTNRTDVNHSSIIKNSVGELSYIQNVVIGNKTTNPTNSQLSNSHVDSTKVTTTFTTEQTNNPNSLPNNSSMNNNINNTYTPGLNQLNDMNFKGLADTIKLLSYGSNNITEPNFYVIYAQQLNSLKLMGFTDTQKCIKALVDTQGNIERAIDKLLDDSNGSQN